jgi:hypothetical protein
MTERYSGGENGTGIREHISKMNHLNNKLKPINLALKEEFFVHMIFLLYQKSLTHLLSITIFSLKMGSRTSYDDVCARGRENKDRQWWYSQLCQRQ